MNVENELNQIVEGVLANFPAIFLVESKRQNNSYEIVIDGDKALGIYDISEISREINRIADERMPEASYSLDITSPGADSDLLLLRQYPKHIGREFRLSLKGDTNFYGKLLNISADNLSFEGHRTDKPKKKDLPETITIPYTDIIKANIILSFK